MNVPVHRNSDSRSCGASTIVGGQGTVFVNNLLASVQGDGNTHGGGALSASVNDGTIFINNKKVVLKGSAAAPDSLCPPLGGAHCAPSSVGASSNVFASGGGSNGASGGSDTEGRDPTRDELYPESGTADLESEEDGERASNNDPSEGGEITPAPGELTDREQEAYDFYVAQGYTPEQAAGIVGNLTNESAVDPTAINPNDAGPGRDSEGVAQWNRDRLENLQGFAAERGTNYQDFETQLAFVDHELRGSGAHGGGSESAAYGRLQNATTATDAAVAMSTYERYRGYELGIQGGETQQRAADAGRILANNG